MAISNFVEQQRGPTRSNEDQRRCYACNKTGHVANRCPTRRHDTNALGEDPQQAPDLDDLFEEIEQAEEYCPSPPQVDRSHPGKVFRGLAALDAQTSPTAIHAYLSLEGRQYKTLIDTGASISLLSAEVLQDLGREVQETDTLPAMTVDRTLADTSGLIRDVQVQVAPSTSLPPSKLWAKQVTQLFSDGIFSRKPRV